MTLLKSATSRGVTTRKRGLIGLATVAAVALLVFLPASASAVDHTWVGTTNSDWGTATNWSPNTLPGSSDNVFINSSSDGNPGPNPTVTSGTCAACAALTVSLASPKTLTVASGKLSVTGAPGITPAAGANVTVSGGTLEWGGTLTVANSGGLTLSGGTIDGTLAASPATTILNTGTNYGSSTVTGLALSSGVTLHQTTNNVLLQGTLAINSGSTYTLDAKSINNGTTGNGLPKITIGSGGKLIHNSGVLDVVEPIVDSDGLIQDQSNGGELDLRNSHVGAGSAPNQYGGTISETNFNNGGGQIVLGGTAAGSGGQVKPGGLIVNNSSPVSKVTIDTSGAGQDFNLTATNAVGQTVTMNGDLTQTAASGAGAAFVKGTGTFQSGPPFPSCCIGALRIHGGVFDTGSDITIPAGTGAFVETADAPWDRKFDFRVNGFLSLQDNSITTAPPFANAPTIHIGPTGELGHQGSSSAAVEVQPVIDQTGGKISDSSDSGGSLTLANPNGVQTDKLQGTLATFNAGNLRLGKPAAPFGTVFLLQGNLTSDTFTGAGTIQTAGTGASLPDLQLNGKTLTIDGTFTHAAGKISGSGTIFGPGTVAGPTVAIPGLLGLTGGKLAPGAPMTIDAPVNQTAPTELQGSTAELDVAKTWTVAGNNNIEYTGSGSPTTFMKILSPNGVLRHTGAGTPIVKAPLEVAGLVENVGAGDWTLTPSSGTVKVDPSGTVKATSGIFKISSLANVSGNVLTNGAYAIADGATLQLPTAVNDLEAKLSIDGSGLLQDTGGNAGLASLALIGSGGSPAGNLTFTGNHSDASDSLGTVAGTLALLGTSTLDNTACGCTTIIDGLLSGTGTFKGDVSNDGVVKPGGSPGTLNVTGNYSQTSTAKLNVELAGTAGGQFGKLQVTGNVNLNGAVAFLPTAGYAASAQTGDVFPFLVFLGPTRTGSFASSSVTPPLNNSKPITLFNNDPGKEVDGIVGQGTSPPPPPPPPHIGPTTTTPPLTTTTTTTVVTPKDTTKPSLSSVGLRASSFKRSKGTKLNVTLSEKATVTVAITRSVRGRRKSGKCKVSNRTGPRCTIVVKVATLTFSGKSGSNAFTFKPSITPRGYTASITAKDAAGNKSKTTTRGFTVRSG